MKNEEIVVAIIKGMNNPKYTAQFNSDIQNHFATMGHAMRDVPESTSRHLADVLANIISDAMTTKKD